MIVKQLPLKVSEISKKSSNWNSFDWVSKQFGFKLLCCNQTIDFGLIHLDVWSDLLLDAPDSNGIGFVIFISLQFQPNISYSILSDPQFMFFQILPNTDVVILCTVIFYGIDAVGIIFAACEIGQRMCNAFEEIEYCWYLFPQQVKRISPIMLLNLQAPVELQIFGSFCCDRYAFSRASIKVTSWFKLLELIWKNGFH